MGAARQPQGASPVPDALEVKERDMLRWPLWLGTPLEVWTWTRHEMNIMRRCESGGGGRRKRVKIPGISPGHCAAAAEKRRDGKAHCSPLAGVPLPLLSFTRMTVVARHYREDRIALCLGR
jgi:hypothetical protein